MTESQGTRLRARATQLHTPSEISTHVFRRVVGIIDDSLVETLGPELALAVRVCLSTSIALTDPVTYASALEVMLGNDKAELVLERVAKRLHNLSRNLELASWISFTESILALRRLYSPGVISSSK